MIVSAAMCHFEDCDNMTVCLYYISILLYSNRISSTADAVIRYVKSRTQDHIPDERIARQYLNMIRNFVRD